jgi:hypothetical protein
VIANTTDPEPGLGLPIATGLRRHELAVTIPDGLVDLVWVVGVDWNLDGDGDVNRDDHPLTRSVHTILVNIATTPSSKWIPRA